jgi:hypothetical protein
MSGMAIPEPPAPGRPKPSDPVCAKAGRAKNKITHNKAKTLRTTLPPQYFKN